MTETYSGSIRIEDIEENTGGATAELDRRADDFLADAEDQTGGSRRLRQAVREDAAQARDWGRDRVVRLRGAVTAEPIKATLYALGLGVLIGMLAAR